MSKPLRIAVVGVGIAGRVRIRDILQYSQQEAYKHITLAGFVSRRPLDIEGAKQIQLEDALSSPNVDALIVCTENERHETVTEQALQAGKHALVEFPLALKATKAKYLLQLAKEKGLCCVEEDIALLSPQMENLKEIVADKTLAEAEEVLEGRYNGWIEQFDKSGSPFVSSISMIQSQLYLFGDLEPQSASISMGEESATARACLLTLDKKPITITITRKKDTTRKKTFRYVFTDGTTVDETSVPREPKVPRDVPGLFMLDLLRFDSIYQKSASSSQIEWITVRSLEIANTLEDIAIQKPV